MAKNDIIQELNELGSSLDGKISGPVYAVPEGYFEGLSVQVLNRIKAMNAANAGEELGYLSPMLSGISKELPYSAPQAYFDGFAHSLLDKVRTADEYQTVDQELESLSPLLGSIGKKVPFSVPEGYFDNFQVDIAPAEKHQAKVIQMGAGRNRHWIRYAAAAVIIGFVALGGMLFFGDGPVSRDNPYEIVKKEVKEVSTTDINDFIETTVGGNVQNQAITASIQSGDMKELMKDISDKDIQKFLNETEFSDEGSDDLFLN